MKTTITLQFENYELVEELSQGEVMTVYRGQRRADQAPVVIKVISPLLASDEFLVRRVKLAAQQTAKLEHPNIVHTYEAEQEGSLLYLIEDFVRAPALAEVLRTEGLFSPQRMQFIARQLASALDCAHQKSVTHGNLSAGKIFLGPDDRVWIADFGLTHALFGMSVPKQSYTMSDPETLAPERVHGQGPSRQSDLYALGILCYQMLAGKPPFSGSPSAILHAQAYQQPRPLYRLNPGIPVAVSEVVGRMLSKGLELRYITGAEFARALSVACSLPKNFPTHGFQQSHQQPNRFLPLWLGSVLSALALLLVIAAGLVWAGYQWGINQQIKSSQAAVAPLSSPKPITLPTSTLPATLAAAEADDSLSLVAIPTATPLRMRLSDTLPTPTLTPIGHRDPTPTPAPVSSAPTPLPTPAQSKPAAVVQPAAIVEVAPAIPPGRGLLIFYNPTGYDLVVDLTGPSSNSKLIPPYTRQEFTLTPGGYQCMIHTPTGQWLAARVLNFEVAAGQVIEKDYYTDYDTQ
ncbi:MAG: protein kinase [Chloroflexi bacterium]|nr:protein kinase [Chloroflexota bacterium]